MKFNKILRICIWSVMVHLLEYFQNYCFNWKTHFHLLSLSLKHSLLSSQLPIYFNNFILRVDIFVRYSQSLKHDFFFLVTEVSCWRNQNRCSFKYLEDDQNENGCSCTKIEEQNKYKSWTRVYRILCPNWFHCVRRWEREMKQETETQCLTLSLKFCSWQK